MRRVLREHGASVVVAGLGSLFGVLLLVSASVTTALLSSGGDPGDTTGDVLTLLAVVFLVLSVYVGAIVTANTFSTVIAGRTKTIALLRLLGSTAKQQRRLVTREGLVVGVVGGMAGVVAGVVISSIVVGSLVAAGTLPAAAWAFGSPALALPPVAVIVSTVASARVGSRSVLTVTPLQAVGSSQEASREATLQRSSRTVVGVILLVAGGLLLVGGVIVGQSSVEAVLIGLVGGLLSFSGVVAVSHLLMPWALHLVGRVFGRGATASLATQNALEHPDRSARATIGLTIGVTLVTTFAVALTTVEKIVVQVNGPNGDDDSFAVIIAIFSGLTGFSAVLAAVGMVSNLSLSVLQRRREIGLLRALGFTGAQVRRMIVIEAAQMAITSIVLGLVLGIAYGWFGAMSLLGSVGGGVGIVTPAVPIVLIVVLAFVAAALTFAASSLPSRRATRVTPVEALAAD